MSSVPITVAIKDYDHITPLATGDVTVEGVDLELIRDTKQALGITLDDPAVDVGELSFSRHIMRIADGDRSFVGLPIFPVQRFRDRCFFTTEGSGLTSLEDLEGKRVGTNEWPATGNTWNRAALRERGVSITDIEWSVGPIDDPSAEMRPQGPLPPNVTKVTEGTALRDMLLAGELDALMCPLPPEGLYDQTSPIVRVEQDYKAAEKAFYRRTNVYPAGHLMGIRREVHEEYPWLAQHIYDAFSEAKDLWQQNRRRLIDTVPWLLPEIEETTELIGEDWMPYGFEAKRPAIEMLCQEEYEQGLIDEPIDPEEVFAEWLSLSE